jgi:hypothetical protein
VAAGRREKQFDIFPALLMLSKVKPPTRLGGFTPLTTYHLVHLLVFRVHARHD